MTSVRIPPSFCALLLTLVLAAHGQAATNLRIVALTGEQAPGMPNGVILDELNRPDINASGHVAFAAIFAGPGVTTANDNTLWSDRSGALSQVAREGAQAVGLPAMVVYKSFPVPILNDEGRLTFESILSGPGVNFENDEGVFSEGTSGVLGVVAREGDQAAGVPANIDYSGIVYVRFNNEGRVVFSGNVKGTGVDVTNQACIWSGFPGGVSLVVRENNQAPELPAGVLLASTSSLEPVLGGDNRSAFFFGLSGVGVNMTNNNAIYAGTVSSPMLIARKGDPAPGTLAGVLLGSLLRPRTNQAGETAFLVFLEGNVDSTNNRAILSEGQSGALHLVARTGNAGPAEAQGSVFSNLNTPLICANGAAVFTAILTGGDIDDSNDECICSDDGGALNFVAREGDPAPGLADGIIFAGDSVAMISAFDGQIVMNAKGQAAFSARIDGPGVDATNNRGIWIHDPVVGVRQILRFGEDIDVLPGDSRTIQDFIWISDSGGSDGRPCAMNDSGQLALWVRFTDGSEAIIVTEDADDDGTADALDNCPLTVNVDQADSDNDGTGDACDDCPDDSDKLSAGTCGCGVSDDDSDGDGVPDCFDNCPNDADKLSPGACGCGEPEADTDGDLILDCIDNAPDVFNPSQEVDNGNGMTDGVGNELMQTEQCCGGGLPVLLPFMLLGLRRRRSTKFC